MKDVVINIIIFFYSFVIFTNYCSLTDLFNSKQKLDDGYFN